MNLTSTVTLNNGHKMPIFALGTWKAEKGKVGQAVQKALEHGYLHIDCSPVYKNEEEVGEAIKAALEGKESRIKRENVFITSKLWNTFHRKEHVEAACRKTLKDLGLDYLDLYLIHWPTPFQYSEDEMMPKDDKDQYKTDNVPLKETWQAMEELVRKGLVKSIGISNFSEQETEHILSFASVKPVVNQVECHPYLPQKELKRYLDSKDIKMSAYSPFGQYDEGESPMDDPKISEIAKKYNKSPAQILLRWGLDRGYAVITKSTNPDRIKENAEIFDFSLDASDVQKINELGEKIHVRLNNPPFRPQGQKAFPE